MKKNGLLTVWRIDNNLLFWFCAIWSAIQFGMCIIEFIHVDTFSVPKEVPFVYLILIILYVLRDDAELWLKRQWKRRKGEIFIICWWCAMLIMFIVQFATHSRFLVPDRMIETCLFVLIPYGVATVLEALHKNYAKTYITASHPTHSRTLRHSRK